MTGYYAFEYDPDFLRSGIEISPLLKPLSKGCGPYVFSNLNRSEFMGLPPVFADSLPGALRLILRVGTSAGGGKAKAVVGRNRQTGQFVAGDRDLPDGYEPRLIKFTPGEYPYRRRRFPENEADVP